MGYALSKTKNQSYQHLPNENATNTSIINPLLPRRQIHLMNYGEKFDSFSLVWIDQKSKESCLDTLHTKALLQQFTNNDNCHYYYDTTTFFNDINGKKTFEGKILLIISGSFAETILHPSMEIQEKISIIIIFCSNSDKYKRFLTTSNSNLTDICTDHDSLKICIQRELLSLKLNLFQNQPFKTIRSLSKKSSTSSLQDYDNTGAYFSYILFVEILKQIPQTEAAKEHMLSKCKDYYREDKKELEKIELFQKEYNSSKAIEWYTKDSFLYKLVNQAFRTEDTTLWYLFRFYIADLCKQLEQVHTEQKLQQYFILYRGQAHMPRKEFDSIQANIGGLISNNGFFSTSKSLEFAKFLIEQRKDTENFKVVLFQIIVDSVNLKNTIFVDINEHLKSYSEEEEILFNIGAVFQIKSVERDEQNKLWIIKMNATDEGAMEIKQRVNLTKKKFQNGNKNLLFGRLLLDMHQYTKAESYFQLMLKKETVLHKQYIYLASIHDYIGDLKMRTTNYQKALTSFQLAYELKVKQLPSDHPNMAVTFNNFGNYYKAIGDLTNATDNYCKALKYKNHPINTAITKLNIAILHIKSNHYLEARNFCFEARDILQQIEPCPHAEITVCQRVMGDISFNQQRYDEAEAFYLAASELGKKYLFIGDPCLTHCINALANFYEKQDDDKTRALNFCHNQLSIHKDYFSDENHISIAHIQMKIGELLDDINWYREALIIFEKNIHQEYASTANCLMMLAGYCDYDEAWSLYSRAHEIHKKIYPVNHSLVIKTQQLLKSEAKQTIQKTSHQDQALNVDFQQQRMQFEVTINNNMSTQMPTAIRELYIENGKGDMTRKLECRDETHILVEIKQEPSVCTLSSEEIDIRKDLTAISQPEIQSVSLDLNQSSKNIIGISEQETKLQQDYHHLEIENKKLKHELELLKMNRQQILLQTDLTCDINTNMIVN